MKSTLLKSLLLSLILLFQIQQSSAQNWVYIPDTNFRAFLNANYANCMDTSGTSIDADCNDVVSATNLNLYRQGIFDLSGFEVFINLKYLSISANQITILPNLPSSLLALSCDGNKLTLLPNLPDSLSQLWCSSNQLINLPKLPESLTLLHCDNNLLDSLPYLPTKLTRLSCSKNFISQLPVLSDSMHSLECERNLLLTLPALPSKLDFLHCSYNNLTYLPSLPNSIQTIYCDNNQLTSLPQLPSSLYYFVCDNNQIQELPPLPPSIQYFSCPFNRITQLPELASNLFLRDFYANDNNIFCLPYIPDFLINLNLHNNPFTCLRNYSKYMDNSLVNYPLCTPGNVYDCIFAPGITGFLFKDSTINCIADSTDFYFPNLPVKIIDSFSSFSSFLNTSRNGSFHFADLNTASYTISIDTLKKPYIIACLPPNNSITVLYDTIGKLIENVNFPIRCKNEPDIGVHSIFPRGWVFPGQTHSLDISAGDMSSFYGLRCANGISGQVLVSVSGPVSYAGIPSGALTPTVAGNTFTYNIADFGTVNFFNAFGLMFTTDTTAQAGDQVCVSVIVSTPTAGDYNPSNDTLTFCYNVFNSYDPNRKDVYPMAVAPGYNDWLTYTVYFQNTGSAPAFNIKLIDSLSALLDPSSFELLGFSHEVTYQLRDRLLTFFFKDIMLPDSLSNPEGSIGYVQFRIKPVSAFTASTVITNQVGIYFDFNPPIYTNVASTAILTSISGIRELGYAVYPNPAADVLTIVFDKAPQQRLSLRLIDIQGKEVLVKKDFGQQSLSLPIGDVANGFYILQIKTADGEVYNTRVVVSR